MSETAQGEKSSQIPPIATGPEILRVTARDKDLVLDADKNPRPASPSVERAVERYKRLFS